MSYIRIKKVNGKEYKYLVKGIRVGEQVLQKVVKYLGPANPIYKAGIKRKTNASIFVRKLNDDEKRKLKTALHSSDAFTRDRAKIFLFSSERMPPPEISRKINCCLEKVRGAIVCFNQNGLESLNRRKAKGAEPKFTEADKKIIIIHFSKSPRKFSVPISAWTLPKFREHLIKFKVVDTISIETLRQILISSGARLKRSKRWQYSPDKQFGEKKEDN